MLAYHNDQKIKDKYVARVKAHAEADNIIRGIGWEDGKGCAVGCTLENYDHSRYPIELGVPEWLARVEDTLFEGMNVEKSRTWPQKFLEAANVGADLEKIKPKFLIMVLKSTFDTFDHGKFPDVKKCIEESIKLWMRDDIGSVNFNNAARAAAEAAGATAWAAAWAARAAAEAAGATAWAAAWAAWAAAWAAGEAARAAGEAAGAAWANKYDYFADELLEMIKAQKPESGE